MKSKNLQHENDKISFLDKLNFLKIKVIFKNVYRGVQNVSLQLKLKKNHPAVHKQWINCQRNVYKNGSVYIYIILLL